MVLVFLASCQVLLQVSILQTRWNYRLYHSQTTLSELLFSGPQPQPDDNKRPGLQEARTQAST